jgi:uncharacterized protein (DUF305 family)
MRGLIRRMTAGRGDGRAEELLRERYARGEIGTEEYEGSLEILGHDRGGAGSAGARPKVLVAGLAAAALLTAGAGVSYAHAQGDGERGENGATGSMMGRGGTGSMKSMMDGGGMGSMMEGGMMDGGQMRPMGSFEENKPFDLQFIDQMIMHHEGAIMSSEHMISDSKRPELRKLAEDIQRSQSEQVKQMQAMRKDWYPDAERTFGMMDPSQMDEMMGDGMMEQMMGGSMREMMGADATDEMFLEMMIPHHQMAVDMSEKALTEAEHPELDDLARKIEDEQSAQIELMKGYLDEIEKKGAN